MGTVFGDDQRFGFGEIMHLASRVVRRNRLVQAGAAVRAELGKMIDGNIRILALTQRLARMPF